MSKYFLSIISKGFLKYSNISRKVAHIPYEISQSFVIPIISTNYCILLEFPLSQLPSPLPAHLYSVHRLVCWNKATVFRCSAHDRSSRLARNWTCPIDHTIRVASSVNIYGGMGWMIIQLRIGAQVMRFKQRGSYGFGVLGHSWGDCHRP